MTNVRTAYDSARSELVERVKLRDHVSTFYMGAILVLLGTAVSSRLDLLYLLVPFAALGATTIVVHHHTMIGLLSAYCCTLAEAMPLPNKQVIWDASGILRPFQRDAYHLRLIAHGVSLLLVPMACLYSTNGQLEAKAVTYQVLWALGVLCCLVILVLLLESHLRRNKSLSSAAPPDNDSA